MLKNDKEAKIDTPNNIPINVILIKLLQPSLNALIVNCFENLGAAGLFQRKNHIDSHTTKC